ncbi:MAG: D-2-hydroxyacid dehydrogenase [Pseudorhodoplanes sp.]
MTDSSSFRLVLTTPEPEITDAIRTRFPDIQLEICNDAAKLPQLVKDFDPQAAFIVAQWKVDPAGWAALQAGASMRWLHIGTVGYERVPRWDAARLTVTNSGGSAADEMAEFVIGSILMANMDFLTVRDNQRRKVWRQDSWSPLRGKTLAVVGAGAIGGRIIAKAADLGMRIVAVRNSAQPVERADLTLPVAKLHEALSQADYVSLQIPHNSRTEHLIDAKALAAMRPSAWLVNVARGKVVDTAALIEALEKKRIGGAVLDVFEQEPLPQDSRLWELDNVFVTPHIAGQVTNWYLIVADLFCDNLARFRSGQPLVNIVSHQG